MQSASASQLESDIPEASGMSFVLNTKAIEGRKGNDNFITDPSSTKQYEFVRRLAAATRVKKGIGAPEAGPLYWLAEVKELSTGKLKVVAIPLEFKR